MEELDLRELFYLFWNKKAEIALITLVLMIIGVIYSYFFVTPVYTAVTSIVLVQSSGSSGQSETSAITSADLTINSKLVSTYGEIIKKNKVLDQVAEKLHLGEDEINKIKNRISVSSVKDTEVIDIAVTDEDPNFAAQVTNEIALVFSDVVKEIFNTDNVYSLDKAEAEKTTTNVNHVKDIAIFTFIGLVLSAIYVLIYNMLDNTIKTEQDIDKCTGLYILTSIPNYEVEFKGTKGGRK